VPHGYDNEIAIRVDDVHLALGDDPPLAVLAGVDLMAPAGEVTAIIGPSGCGKSTLLDVIAGLVTPDSGSVVTASSGRPVLMPQRDALMPWRTLRDNVAAAAELRGIPRPDARARADHEVARVGLAGFGDHYPHALSGGMRQRGALARTLLAESDIWLLDEPFGALDALTRSEMHRVLVAVREQVAPTIVLVTHDIAEAVAIADTVLVASPGPMRIVSRVRVADAGPDAAHDILTSLRAAGVAA
jgi:ABC-type nitrate/sulfonate/bicarbonate transport system ATPase subunit